MKKQTHTLAAMLLLISASSFALGKHENKAVDLTLLKNQVAVEIKEDTGTGKRQVPFNSLPANVQYAVRNQYANFEPNKMVTEFTAGKEVFYYITVENESRVIDLRCGTDGEITMEGSSRKKNK